MSRATTHVGWVGVLAIAAALAAACSAPSATPTPSGGSPTTSTPVPTPTTVVTPTGSVTPTPVPTAVASATARPALEWGGRIIVMIDQQGPSLVGNAVCRTVEGGDRVASVEAGDIGAVGGHRVFVRLELRELPGGEAYLSIGQGTEDLPQGSLQPERAGSVVPASLRLGTARVDGTFRFTALTEGDAPLIGSEWPAEITGMVGWACDPIPAGPTPQPAHANGSAKLGGSISGIFAIRGGDCPTPEQPDGFLSGTGTMDTGEAILEVTVAPGSVAFALYRTPGDKQDVISATVAATIEAAGRGWATHLRATLGGIGPVTLDVEWACGG